MSNPLTETYSEFKSRKFNQGKIDGFSEACELVERQYIWLDRDPILILSLRWAFIRLYRKSLYGLGYMFGFRLAFAYFGGTNAQR